MADTPETWMGTAGDTSSALLQPQAFASRVAQCTETRPSAHASGDHPADAHQFLVSNLAMPWPLAQLSFAAVGPAA